MKCYVHVGEIKKAGNSLKSVVCLVLPENGLIYKVSVNARPSEFRQEVLKAFIDFLVTFPEISKRVDFAVYIDDWILANYLEEVKVKIAVKLERIIPFSAFYIFSRDNPAISLTI